MTKKLSPLERAEKNYELMEEMAAANKKLRDLGIVADLPPNKVKSKKKIKNISAKLKSDSYTVDIGEVIQLKIYKMNGDSEYRFRIIGVNTYESNERYSTIEEAKAAGIQLVQRFLEEAQQSLVKVLTGLKHES